MKYYYEYETVIGKLCLVEEQQAITGLYLLSSPLNTEHRGKNSPGIATATSGECRETNRSKVKVSKWLDTPNQGKNHDFLCKWHYLLKDVEKAVKGREDSEYAKRLNMSLLTQFYFGENDTEEEFYRDFEEKVNRFREEI